MSSQQNLFFFSCRITPLSAMASNTNKKPRIDTPPTYSNCAFVMGASNNNCIKLAYSGEKDVPDGSGESKGATEGATEGAFDGATKGASKGATKAATPGTGGAELHHLSQATAGGDRELRTSGQGGVQATEAYTTNRSRKRRIKYQNWRRVVQNEKELLKKYNMSCSSFLKKAVWNVTFYNIDLKQICVGVTKDVKEDNGVIYWMIEANTHHVKFDSFWCTADQMKSIQGHDPSVTMKGKGFAEVTVRLSEEEESKDGTTPNAMQASGEPPGEEGLSGENLDESSNSDGGCGNSIHEGCEGMYFSTS